MSEEINFENFLSNRQSYGIEKERQDDMEIFHERTRYFASTILNKSMKVGRHMSNRGFIEQMANHYKPYLQSRKILLPKPNVVDTSYSEAVRNRASVRDFSGESTTLQTLSTLLYHAAGVTRTELVRDFQDIAVHKRVYPSAGNLFPIEIYLALLNVDGLQPCLVHYDPIDHELDIVRDNVVIEDLENALADNENMGSGYTENLTMVVFLTSLFQRSVAKYEERGYRFALLEAGIIGYSFALAASALELGCLNWGAFYDVEMDKLLKVDGVHETTVNSILIGQPGKPL